jgi:hypothetical protein
MKLAYTKYSNNNSEYMAVQILRNIKYTKYINGNYKYFLSLNSVWWEAVAD